MTLVRRRGLLALAFALAAIVSTSASGAPAERFDRNGIVFQYPDSWFVTTKPLSNGVNPTYRFTASTHPVRRTPRDSGPCLPGIGEQLPRTAVLAYLREAVGADRRFSLPRMTTRPKHFRLPTRSDTSLCGFGPGGRWVPFKSGGRAFYLGIYVGPRASAANVRAVSRIIDGMTIEPR